MPVTAEYQNVKVTREGGTVKACPHDERVYQARVAEIAEHYAARRISEFVGEFNLFLDTIGEFAITWHEALSEVYITATGGLFQCVLVRDTVEYDEALAGALADLDMEVHSRFHTFHFDSIALPKGSNPSPFLGSSFILRFDGWNS